MRLVIFLSVFGLGVLAGCGGIPIGEECKLTSGALGFGFDDPCKTKCLELEDVTCADGTKVREAVCAGKQGCDPGTCGDGEMCYSFEDTFEKEFFCIPDDICGSPPATVQERQEWELASRERSDAVRAKYEARRKRRSEGSTSPAADAEPLPKPVSTPSVEPPPLVRSDASVLVEAWGADLALVACLSGETVGTGTECARHLPSGTEWVHASRRRRSTGAKSLECAATSRAVSGVGTELLESAETSSDRWGWLPAPPRAWQETGLEPLDPILEAVMRRHLGETRDDVRFELAVAVDLDGDPNKEKVIRVFYPPADVEKPGHAALWLIDDGSLAPLPTGEWDLNGVANVRGIVPLASGGALLVFTTEWMGGSGVHVVGPVGAGLGLIAEVSCGS